MQSAGHHGKGGFGPGASGTADAKAASDLGSESVDSDANQRYGPRMGTGSASYDAAYRGQEEGANPESSQYFQ
jgi:hypothetical protein